MDFSTLELLENNVSIIIDRLDALKNSLLVDKDIDAYYEYASFVESTSQIIWDMEYRLNEQETLQNHLDVVEYINIRQTVSSDKRADSLIETKFYEDKKKISHYRWVIRKLRARYGWCTHLISAIHDWFYFNSRINA